MPQYLVAGYLPDDFDPSTVDEAMINDIHALNKEMIAAGVRKFACGLGATKSLRAQAGGEILVTDGPTWRPRNTSAASGSWNAPTWTRRWPGRAKVSSPLAARSRSARSSSCLPRIGRPCRGSRRAVAIPPSTALPHIVSVFA